MLKQFQIESQNELESLFSQNISMPMLIKWDQLSVVADKSQISKVSGYATKGNLTAFLGTENSGYNIDEASISKIQGQISINDKQIDQLNFPYNSISYVQKDDIFIETFTPHELLMFYMMIRVQLQTKKRNQLVDKIIKDLDLAEVADMAIGDLYNYGLTKSERKLLALGVQLTTNPQIILLEDPTGELDYGDSIYFLNILQNIAKNYKKTVICSLSKPSIDYLNYIDKFYVFSKGKVVYDDTFQNIESCLEELKLTPPKDSDKLKFLLDAFDYDRIFLDNLVYNGIENHNEAEQTQRTLTELANQYVINQAHDSQQQYDKDLEEIKLGYNPKDLVHQRYGDYSQIIFDHTNFYNQTWLYKSLNLIKRSYIDKFRRPSGVKLNLYHCIIVSLMILGIFYNLGQSRIGIYNRQSLCFFLSTTLIFVGLQNCISNQMNDKKLFQIEVSRGIYTPGQYIFSKIMVTLPLVFICPFLIMSIIYFLIGMNTLNTGKFIMGVIIAQLSCSSGIALGILLSCLPYEKSQIKAIASYIVTLFVLCSGFFGHHSGLSKLYILLPFHYISIWKWSYQAFVLNEFEQLFPLTCVYDEPKPCDALKEFNYSENIVVCCLILLIYQIAYFGLSFVLLNQKAKKKTFVQIQ